MTVRDARAELSELLGHWKDGTRPGDSRITDGDVAYAVFDLVKAMLDEAEAAKDHSR